ncbi:MULTISPECIES: ABC transporter permease subunit [Eubacteriales]|uniref:ABC transporter permease subunit n=1 Tax=Clostridia TaxID=186801 RepID=UPI001FAAFE67|nr:ABC transporter permease [Clostridium sp. AM33-3]
MRNKWDLREILQKNAVTVMFVVLCLIGLVCSGQTVSYVMYELFGRLSRNSFIVLALIIPIIAGMGINFAITIGAMAAQIAALWVIEWGISGLAGFLTAMAITMPIAAFFGFLIGKLMNKMKGQEMIGGLILGYFANGLYQLLFLFIFGNLIPLKAPGLVIKGSTGVANTIDLSTERGFKYALDGLCRVPFGTAALILCGLIAVWSLVKLATKKEDKKKALTRTGICVAVAIIAQLPFVTAAFSMVSVPMVTFLIVALLCVFNNAIMKTRIGQQFRAVGQNRTVANAAGINVDRVRVIAIIISTVLAGWGQLIFVQNMGSFQTYGAHEQVGLYAGAAILVGGASIKKATNGQALLGCILFHLLFIVAPSAGKNLFGDAAIGEYFRVFISYGVIALALVIYAWGDIKKKKAK